MNGWDLPTYLGLAVLCIILQQWLNHDRQFSVTLLRDICYAVVPLVALSYLFFLPFYRHYIAPTGGIGLVEAKDRTTLHDELLIYGLFAFVFLSLLATSIWSQPLLAAGRAKTSAGRAKTSAGRAKTSAGRAKTSAGRAKTSAGRAKTSCAPTAATASELKDEDHAEPIAKENEPKIEKNEIPVTDEHEILVAEDSVRSAVAVGAELVSAPTATADLTSDPTDTTDGYFSWPLIGMLAGSGFFIIGLAMNFISPQNATVFVMLGLTIIGAVQTLRHLDDRAFAFTLLAGTLACALVTGCEIIFLRDAFVNSQPRYNTVFKFYIQAWILLSISCGAGLYFILCRIKAIRSMSRMTNALQWSGKIIWALCLIALLGMGAVYPIVAPYYRVMRYDPKTGQGGVYQSSSLDGMAYFKYDQYHIGDYEAIHWLNANVPDDSVIVEAVYNNDYSDFGRVSSFTGLQTIMGWIGHEYQWRMGSDVQSASLLARQHDVDVIYTSTNQQQVLNTMKRYHAQYLYVGLMEHIRYPDSNLERFKAFMQVVYQNNNVTIYKLK
jgi:uncharacterized membrane protein